MHRPPLYSAISKLAIAGEHAGFSLEQMIQLLDDGLSVETLLDVIAWSLEKRQRSLSPLSSSSGWIM